MYVFVLHNSVFFISRKHRERKRKKNRNEIFNENTLQEFGCSLEPLFYRLVGDWKKMYFSIIWKFLPLNQVTGPSNKSMPKYAIFMIILRGGGRSSCILIVRIRTKMEKNNGNSTYFSIVETVNSR